MTIEERVEISILMKYYGSLLTDRQRDIFSMYVDNNLSLAEVSDELKITRQAVKDALDTALLTLKDAEEKMQFVARDNKLKKEIEENSSIDMITKLKLISILEDN